MRKTFFINRFLIAAAVLGSLTMAARADDSSTELTAPPKPGRFTLTIKSGDFDRVARIQIPAGYKSDQKPPLVLLLHGAGGSGTGILDKDGWSAKADQKGFIAVAPDGLPARPRLPPDFRTNPALWNSGQLKPLSPRAAIDDVAYVRQLLDELKEKLPFDEGRVFCAGHSNGAGMTFRLATELSERFTAVGMVAGMKDVADAKPKKPLPTMYILGTKDPLMPIDGGEVKLPWGSRHNRPVADMLSAWAKAMGCEPEPKTVSDKDGLKKIEYASKSNGPTLSVIYIEGQGHNWPGGQRTLPESMVGPSTDKLDATDVIWDFFFKARGSSAAK
jgi:polyhydroxybutyrate depolymerase